MQRRCACILTVVCTVCAACRAQGDEYDEFEVDASHYNGDGLLLMALSRVCKLSGLKLTGISSMKQFKFKAKIDWKVEKL